MSFFFLNCKPNELFSERLGKYKVNLTTIAHGNEIEIFYSNAEFDSAPFLEIGNHSLYLSGWFVSESGERNNIEWLLKKIIINGSVEKVLPLIEAGVFTAVYFNGDALQVFSDPFSLSPHYYTFQDGFLKVSPSARELSINGEENEFLKGILKKQGHLFGRHTTFKNVFRFNPGDILDIKKDLELLETGFEFSREKNTPEDILYLMKSLVESTNKDKISIALSAGFDSRLAFLSSEAAFSYTWGPDESLDVINGKRLANSRGIKHYKFGFKDNDISSNDLIICKYLFSGSVDAFNPQFLVNYQRVSENSIKYPIALDGYLGDVIQRGAYFCFSGFSGELLKLFPFMLKFVMNERLLLRRRYQKLNNDEFSLIWEDYLAKGEIFKDLDGLQKVSCYEFLYGRGLRYITTGSLVMNSMYKSVFPVFASRKIFSCLISESSSDMSKYKTFFKIWKMVPKFEREMRSEGSYSPATNPIIIPYLNFLGRLLTNYYPKRHNYVKK